LRAKAEMDSLTAIKFTLKIEKMRDLVDVAFLSDWKLAIFVVFC